MLRNCCDAYLGLHRKWAYFASQIAMRYQLFPSLILGGFAMLIHGKSQTLGGIQLSLFLDKREYWDNNYGLVF